MVPHSSCSVVSCICGLVVGNRSACFGNSGKFSPPTLTHVIDLPILSLPPWKHDLDRNGLTIVTCLICQTNGMSSGCGVFCPLLMLEPAYLPSVFCELIHICVLKSEKR